MSAQQIHFVTGRLAEKALRQTVERLSAELNFIPTVQVMPITVAALMTPDWITKRLELPEGTTRVIVPGYCDDVFPIQEQFQVEVQAGPKDLRKLGEFLGGKAESINLEEHDIEIIAEINHAPKLSIAELVNQATELTNSGADLIDYGCIPGTISPQISEAISALKQEGIRVSIDSLNPQEISAATKAGAELVLSVNKSNREFAADWGVEVVAIPDDFGHFEGIDETLNLLDRKSVPYRIDPILEPIGCGFANSLQRYLLCRRLYPEAEIMMGIGNLTELSDVDSAGVNFLLLGFCQELGIRSVLTTQVINWARSSVRECDLARRIVHYAVKNRVPAKHVGEQLVSLRDPKLDPHSGEFIEELATQIRDHNFRIFADGDKLHVLGAQKHFQDRDPFEVFDSMLDSDFTNLDASHSFYLGFEMCKAMLANQLGKEYQQDQALNWGHLTVDEKDRHRLKKRKKEE